MSYASGGGIDDPTITKSDKSWSNPGEMRDEKFGDVVKKKLTQATGLAREVMQDSKFLARKLRVKYGGGTRGRRCTIDSRA